MAVCLNMIVKNEAHVIRRCLDSVRPFVDCWVIVDTGSTDGTQDLIRTHFADVPGVLHERPWQNFGHNRSEALELARLAADYTFVMDADDELVVSPGFKRPALTADAYSVLIRYAGYEYRRTCLFSNRLSWRYVGVLHEYPEADAPFTVANLDGIHIVGRIEGGRSSMGLTEKYLKDAEILEAALCDEPQNTRYAFYLAQSYRDAGRLQSSLEAYQRRAGMGGWAEEVWYSLYEIAKLSERLGLPAELVTQRYLEAYDARPQRAETLVQLARLFRERGKYALAHLFAEKALATPRPADILFVETAAYDWCALDEYAVASFWIGNYEACRKACVTLLACPALPAAHQARIAANRDLAVARMKA